MPVSVIDAHTHLFSPDVIRRRDYFVQSDRWFGLLYENPLAKLAVVADLIESMDIAGVETSVVCGFPWSDPGVCREQNDFLAEACELYPGRLTFLGIVVPNSPAAAVEAERCFKMGAAGIGELNADAQAFSLLQPDEMRDLMEVSSQAGKPVMLHATEPVGHIYPGKGQATPARLVHWLTSFPDQPVVLAHWGGGLPFYELMPEVLAVTRNVVYDSAATTYLYRPDVFRHVAGLVGSDRVLFASDFPVLGQVRLLNRVKSRFGDADFFQGLIHDNAARVYDIQVNARSSM
jgi:uncharacterized protein